MKANATHRLLDWERQAIVDAYVAGEKRESIGEEFRVTPQYAAILARRNGHPPRAAGRPPKQKVTIAS